MPKTKTTIKKPQKAQNKPYRAVMTILGKDYVSEGESVLEAIQGFKMKYTEIKARGVLRIEHGNEVYEKLMNAPQLRRLCNNKISQNIWAKQIEPII